MRNSDIFVTVDVVVFKPDASNGQIVLIRRKNPPFENHWALPGGFVDHNEDLADAARRELREETGLDVAQVKQLKAFGRPGRDPRGHTVSIAFLTEITDVSIEPQAADDATEARWFSIGDLPALAFDHGEIIDFALERLSRGDN